MKLDDFSVPDGFALRLSNEPLEEIWLSTLFNVNAERLASVALRTDWEGRPRFEGAPQAGPRRSAWFSSRRDLGAAPSRACFCAPPAK
jgi:hypothetical protein